jgi:hypothetical protein
LLTTSVFFEMDEGIIEISENHIYKSSLTFFSKNLITTFAMILWDNLWIAQILQEIK